MADQDTNKSGNPVAQLEMESKTHIPQVAKKDGATKAGSKWNTKNLVYRMAADFVSAAAAASMVAPVIAIIDRSIMENASGRASLTASVKSSLQALLLRPHTMLLSKPVALIFLTYGGTYLTANTIDTLTSTMRHKSAAHVTSGAAKFAASSAANIGLGIYKDQVFARMFGPAGGVVRSVPTASYALFTARDCITIFASFNLPMMLGPRVDAALAASSSSSLQQLVSGQTLVQFAAPAAIQVLSTPPHLLGLDLYNRPRCARTGLPTPGERWAQVRKNWGISVAARLCRIVPAYGAAGVVNVKVRKSLMDKL